MDKINIIGSWIIKAPLLNVYNIISDFEKAPEYFPAVAASMKVIKKQGNYLSLEAVTKTFGFGAKVAMDTVLIPPYGFKSINKSIIGTEEETFLLEQVPQGTRIKYTNEVTVLNPILRKVAGILLGKFALSYWEHAYIDKLKKLLEF